MKVIHGEPLKFWQTHGLNEFPPVECQFKVGDLVDYTNDQGVIFNDRVVAGFSSTVQSWGGFIHLENNCWWCPVKPSNLNLSAGKAVRP